MGRGHVSEGAGANMNDMTSAVLCDKGGVGGYRRGVVVGKSLELVELDDEGAASGWRTTKHTDGVEVDVGR